MARSKTIVITGAGRGIGAKTAVKLGSKGWHVFVTGLAHEAKELQRIAREAGNPHAWAVADVRNFEQMKAAMKRAVDVMGRIDVVMANAGIARQMPIENSEYVDELRLTLEVNTLGSVQTVLAALPYLKQTKGHVLIISSLAADVSLPLASPYSASKAALSAFTEALRLELRPHGITVGQAKFSELDTDMTTIGFGTSAAEYLLSYHGKRVMPVAPVDPAINAVVRAIKRRRSIVVSPRRASLYRRFPWAAQFVVGKWVRPRMARGLELARSEQSPRTTNLPPSN